MNDKAIRPDIEVAAERRLNRLAEAREVGGLIRCRRERPGLSMGVVGDERDGVAEDAAALVLDSDVATPDADDEVVVIGRRLDDSGNAAEQAAGIRRRERHRA
jgi:hypothetical protein